MKLIELEPRWLSAPDSNGARIGKVQTFQEAQGIRFWCPRCAAAKADNIYPLGAHQVIIWFADRNVPSCYFPKPYRWSVAGNSFENLTLAPSVHLTPGCGWHGWIRNGEVIGVP